MRLDHTTTVGGNEEEEESLDTTDAPIHSS